MEKLLRTKDLADAIGASESSLRRWTNSGAIRTSRTVGGHRRIPLSEAIRFIRESHLTVVRPELLGLTLSPAGPAQGGSFSAVELEVTDLLKAGNVEQTRSRVLSLYVGGANCPAIFDSVIEPAMARIGALWEHSKRGIMIEHRAVDICLQVVHQLRQLLSPAAASAPVAVGGAPSNDPYLLPSLMVATVLAEAGFRDMNFGPDTPLELLANAAEEHKAEIVWISASVEPKTPMQRDVAELSKRLAKRKGRLVIGGKHGADLLPKPLAHTLLLGSMSELAAFVRGARG